MTNDPIYERLRELSWQRRLTGPEEAELRAWLKAHPETEADWEAEAGLNAGLSSLPDVPVPGNFTARVLQAVEREAAAELRRPRGNWLTRGWSRWLPRMALATAVVVAGLVSYQQVEAIHRKKLAESVAMVSAVSSLPSPEILKDFDAIQASKSEAGPGRAIAGGAAMNLPGGIMLRAAILLGASQLMSALLLAQATTNRPALPGSSSVAAAQVGSSPQAPAEMPPLLLPDRSPIAFFRELLAMDADELEKALAKYTPERQTQILAKVREYEALDPDDRALRLHVTELRWYLRPLMATPAAERADQLARIPEPNRSLLKARLSEWDKVPIEVQKELLGLEPTLQRLAESEGRDELQRHQMLNSLSPSRRKMLEKGFQRWDAMSGEQQQRTLSRFNQFFDLTATEKEKALKTLSEPEQRQIEKTLRTFGSLSDDQRTRCVSSFEKFASLSLVERQEFLKNAERWKLMSPGEREAWRQLVNHLPPPPPPRPLPPPPPLPRYPPVPVAATNRN